MPTTTNRADTLYVYDELGNAVRTGLDINNNGTLDLASMDQISETEIAFANEPSAWWTVRTNKVYATDNSDTATTVSIQKTRLNSFSGNFVAETKEIDIHGNETIQTTTIDQTNKTVTQTVNMPDSSIDMQTIAVNSLVTSKRTASNLINTYAYDDLGRPIGFNDPRTGTYTVSYYTAGIGKIGQIHIQTDAAGNYKKFGYNEDTGSIKFIENALGKQNYYAYNALGQITKTWGDSFYPLEVVYDNFGQKIQLKTYKGGIGWTGTSWPIATSGDVDISTWTYDEASGKITSKTYADSKSTNYAYTIDGKIKTIIWTRTSNGQPLVTTFIYDVSTGEQTSIDYSDTTQDIAYTYNRLGEIKTVVDVVGARTFAYDSALQPITETIVGGLYSKTIIRDYATTGMVGRYTGVHIGTEYDVDYGYDTYGRFSSITNGSDIFTYNYLANSGLVSSITYPNNISVNYSYENSRDLVSSVENKVGTTKISKYDYTNDVIGRRTSMAKSGTAFTASDTITYSYNDRSEVTNADAATDANYNFIFDYDNIGNRKSYTTSESGNPVQSIYTANNLNQYTAITNPPQSPTYDDDGNMLTDGKEWNNTWNCENRLIETYNNTVGKKLEFKYDYMGRRVEKKVYTGSSTTSWTLSTHKRFVYDGYKCIEALDC